MRAPRWHCPGMLQVRRALLIQISGLVLVMALFAALSRVLPLADWLAAVQQEVVQWGAWSAICYPLLYAFCNVLLLPGGFLSIGGGFFFGLWWGFLFVLIGNMLGAAMAFFISRWIGERWLQPRLMGNRTIEALAPAVEREGWKIILLSQLHPLFPTSLMNYLYGLTTIRFRTCMLWVTIGQAPGLFLYAYLGTLGQLGLNLVRGKTHPHAVEYLVWGGGLLLSVAVLVLLGRIAMRLLQEAQEEALQKHQREAVTAPAMAGISD
ncbi:MAG TPA: TVP38/TMEM64 family protein [Chthoniobacterales bacterium]|nr:TVP38/TMEM64 family protein [Chthoniobacterales bacterium]